MSVSTAIQMIAHWSGKLDVATADAQEIQFQLEVSGKENTTEKESLRKKLADLNFRIGLYKEFIDFWKNIIQQTLNLIKSLQELAQGAR